MLAQLSPIVVQSNITHFCIKKDDLKKVEWCCLSSENILFLLLTDDFLLAIVIVTH